MKTEVRAVPLTLLEDPSVEAHDHTQVLFREAKQRRRRRWLFSGLVIGVVLVMLGIAAGFLWGSGGEPSVYTIRVPAPPAVVPSAPPLCSGNSSGFELMLVHDYGGQPSPVQAAEWFATHGGVPSIPTDGWHEANLTDQGVTVYSGKTLVNALRGSDGTWQVDSGMRCL